MVVLTDASRNVHLLVGGNHGSEDFQLWVLPVVTATRKVTSAPNNRRKLHLGGTKSQKAVNFAKVFHMD